MSLHKEHSEIPIAISSLLTIPAIIALPRIAKGLNMSSYEAGSWFGGCVDSTGAVIASANAFGGAETISSSAVVKMAQNALIAPLSVIVTLFVVRYPKHFHLENEKTKLKATKVKVPTTLDNINLLWSRFPKFVIGFVVSAIFYNTVVPLDERQLCKNFAFVVSEWFSTCSFVSIGMSLRLRTLVHKLSHLTKLIFFYILVQTVDIIITGGFAKAAFSL
eukprot:c18996_g1_i2.p1 GENE.c18996_g1_i2~~c18996_g1_i2.p1  ORF type:complete len:219 (+),score=65.73 c18996_g1_i2:1-657(+)